MEDELLDNTQPEENFEPEGEIPGDEGTQDGIAQGGEGGESEPRLSADDIARDTELKLLRQFFQQENARPLATAAQEQVDPIAELLKGRADDDLMTTRDVRELLLKSRETTASEVKTQVRDVLEDIARINYKDYDEVLEKYTAPLIRRNPDLLESINRSRNPAETAYRIGQSHPDFIKAQIKSQTGKVADKIQQNATKPKTLSARASGTPRVSGNDKWGSMSDADFENALVEITGRR